MARPSSAVRDMQSAPSTDQLDHLARALPGHDELRVITAGQPIRAVVARRLSAASAALILVGGYVHFCLYRHGYRFIPKIGVSFLLQAASSALLTALLLVGGRPSIRERGPALAQLARLSGIGLSLGTLAALGLAHTNGGLFQFHEVGLRPSPQTLVAIVAESLATLFLALAMAEDRAAAHSRTATAVVRSPTVPARRHAA